MLPPIKHPRESVEPRHLTEIEMLQKIQQLREQAPQTSWQDICDSLGELAIRSRPNSGNQQHVAPWILSSTE